MSKLFAPTAILLLLTAPSLSQPDSSIIVSHGYEESSLSVNLGGPTYFISASLGQYLSDKAEYEIGLGLVGIYGGGRYHLLFKNLGKEREFLSPYTGLFCSYGLLVDTTDSPLPVSHTTALYLPLGVQFHGLEHFQFSAEIAVVKLLYNTDRFKSDLFLWPSLKFGLYF